LLLTIDTQHDYTLSGAPAEIEGTAQAVPQLTRLVEAFRTVEMPIVHVIRLENGHEVAGGDDRR
jgi:nicotinamidase-related amidase